MIGGSCREGVSFLVDDVRAFDTMRSERRRGRMANIPFDWCLLIAEV